MKHFENVPLHELQSIADCAADIDLADGDWLISDVRRLRAAIPAVSVMTIGGDPDSARWR